MVCHDQIKSGSLVADVVMQEKNNNPKLQRLNYSGNMEQRSMNKGKLNREWNGMHELYIDILGITKLT